MLFLIREGPRGEAQISIIWGPDPHYDQQMSYQLLVHSAESARAFQVVAALAGLPLTVKVVSNDAAAVTATPFGTLPVLVTRQGAVSRTTAILRFLGNAVSGEALCGAAGLPEAEVDQWLSWAAFDLEPLLAELSVSSAEAHAALAVKLPSLLAYIEARVASRTWLVGPRCSVADVAVASALADAWDSGIVQGKSTLPAVTRWYLTCRAQPVFVAAFGAAKDAPAAASVAAAAVAPVPPSGAAVAPAAAAPSAGVMSPAMAASLVTSDSAVLGLGNATRIDGLFSRRRARVAEVLRAGDALLGAEVTMCGWVKTMREGGAGSISFIALNDGSSFDNIQAVAEKDKTEGFASLASCGGTGSSVRVVGKVVKSPAKGQAVELLATSVTVLGRVDDPAEYALAKKKHSLEYLREIQHLRPRTNTIGAVTRVRNACAYATHRFFQERGFLYIHTPIITTADCEGAGEMFQVTTLAPEAGKAADMPRNKDGSVDYKKDFFGKPAMMTVSGQLQVEAFACAMSDVYTFGPTFRAENSHTSRHLAEFWMIEPEVSGLVSRGASRDATQPCPHPADRLRDAGGGHVPRGGLPQVLHRVGAGALRRGPRLLRGAVREGPAGAAEERSGGAFQAADVHGGDRATDEAGARGCGRLRDDALLGLRPRVGARAVHHGEGVQEARHPHQLSQGHQGLLHEAQPVRAGAPCKRPPSAHLPPPSSPRSDGKTVAAMDVLVPKIGEIMGGSQREDDYALLKARMADMKVPAEPLEWYMDLRRYGTVPHAGFGLGFERLVMYVTGIENIRDAIPFPRFPGNAAL